MIMDILKFIRKYKNVKQTELSSLLGIQRSTYSNYETGYREPDIMTVKILSDYFNISTDYLITGCASRFNEKLFEALRTFNFNVDEVIKYYNISEKRIDILLNGELPTKEEINIFNMCFDRQMNMNTPEYFFDDDGVFNSREYASSNKKDIMKYNDKLYTALENIEDLTKEDIDRITDYINLIKEKYK